MRERAGKFLADVVMAVHFAYVGAVILALPAVLAWPAARTPILIVMVAMLGVWAVTEDCPLRTLEHRLRLRFHPDGAHGEGFLFHHFGRPLGLSGRVTWWANLVYPVLIIAAILFV